MSVKEANKQIAERIAAAEQLISEAESIADDSNLEFSFGLSYGMGGTYYPNRDKDDWNSSDQPWYDSDYSGRWVSSSEQC